ncbi:unnamed protein product [Didymodactylos carnosus]|uniref:Tetratricopeptide repeat protein n=1 Tax=Didymodactylos carnosus TaxID=1234261 RepID=A0A8S2EA31_9BILA|nr:unnamed protein product [Didymodactylos carnosus]CAF3872774.1 unnamed protein product [Didymodactylos carnosus]
MISRVHELVLVIAIYTFSDRADDDYEWPKKYEKIRKHTIFSQDLVSAISSYQHSLEEMEDTTSMPLSIFSPSSSSTTEGSSSNLNGDFLWFQVFIKVLLRMQHSDKEQNELVQLCKGTHRGNTSELNDINDFELTYNPLMSNDELERIRVSVGNYVSMNSFFSTTLDRTYALFLISSAGAASSTTLQPILFEIDPLKEGMKPFADISAESHFNTEREVLFMLGSIFKIENVILTTTTDGNSYWSIKLSLASENDYELREKNYEEALVYFIRALEIEETCLPSDHYEIAKACENIRFIRFNLGDYETALPFFEKGFNIKRKSLPAQHVDLGMTYHNFGLIYEQTEKLKEASENFLMAKQIYRLY